MLPILAEEALATRQFFAQVLRPGDDSAEVLDFDSLIDVLQPFTSSREELTAAVAQLRTPTLGESGTRLRLYDAVRYAAESMANKRDGRNAIILLSDGMDVQSQTTTLATAIESAQRADTTVFTIFMGDDPTFANRKRCAPTPCKAMPPRGKRSWGDPNRGPVVMARLAHETGGGLFEITQANSIERIYAEIEDELRSQYVIAFTPEQTDASGKYRRLKLTTVQNGLTVKTRDGYYPR
jgi:VWFA-related protein